MVAGSQPSTSSSLPLRPFLCKVPISASAKGSFSNATPGHFGSSTLPSLCSCLLWFWGMCVSRGGVSKTSLAVSSTRGGSGVLRIQHDELPQHHGGEMDMEGHHGMKQCKETSTASGTEISLAHSQD